MLDSELVFRNQDFFPDCRSINPIADSDLGTINHNENICLKINSYKIYLPFFSISQSDLSNQKTSLTGRQKKFMSNFLPFSLPLFIFSP